MTLTIKIDDADYQMVVDSIMEKIGVNGVVTDFAWIATTVISKSAMENMIASYINKHQDKIKNALIEKSGVEGIKADAVHISATAE